MALSEAEIIKNLGPLATLAGTWEGVKGDDIAPSDDRQTENNKFREKLSFIPFGPVNNHEQELWGLKYSTMAWRLGEVDSFHEEVGYWLWEPKTNQVLRCFLIPRGISVIAGGTVAANATEFKLSAELGSRTFGICSNPFLDREFRTEKYELTIKIHGPNKFEYFENTMMRMPGRDRLFEHTDQNVLERLSHNN